MEQSFDVSASKARQLGPLENYSFCRSKLGIYLNVCVTASYLIKSDEALKPLLFRAVTTVVQNHPVLSAVPMDVETQPRFVRVAQVDLERVVTFAKYDEVAPVPGDPALDEILECQHNLPFTYEEPPVPFWRLCVLHSLANPGNMTVCLCFHHSLADTKSALVFLEDLEHALSFASTNSFTSMATDSPEALLPPLENIFDLKTSSEFIQKLRNLGGPSTNTWSGAAQTLPVRTKFSSLWFPSAVFNGLRAQCKLRGVSITAVLMAVAAKAFFNILPAKYESVWGDCAVSLRPFLPLPITEKSMGCYVGSFSQVYDRATCSIWEHSQRTKSAINKVRHEKGADMPVGFLRHINDISKWLLEKLGKRRWAAWELSNVGTLTQMQEHDQGNCYIQGLLFSQSASACSGAVKLSAATGRDGQMMIGFSWQQGVVEDELVGALIKQMDDLVQQVAGEY